MLVREMRENEIDEIVTIEQKTFGQPWSRAAFIKSCTEDNNVFLVVIDEEDRIVGYGGFIKAAADEGHITKIAVKEGHRRQGIGRLLVNKILDEARERGINSLTLEVRKSNKAAINLYEQIGFVQTAIRRDFYLKPKEDAVIMWLRQIQ